MSWILTTLNVNGIRSAARKGFPKWRSKERCDVLALRKCEFKNTRCSPSTVRLRGWTSVRVEAEKKGYSGVATGADCRYSRPAKERVSSGQTTKDAAAG